MVGEAHATSDPRPRVGFGAGIRCFFEGAAFVVGTPRMWPSAAAPVATAVALFAATGALAYWGANHLVRRIVDTGPSASHAWGAEVFFALLSLVAAFIVALAVTFALAQPLSGWALDRLVRAQERRLGVVAHPSQPALAQMARALGVALLGLAASLPLLLLLQVVTFFFPAASVVAQPLQFVVTALLVAWGFLDYPFSQRGVGVGARLRWIGSRFGAVLGFGLAAALLLFVPCVGFLVLPLGVAGAARLVAEGER